MKDKAREFREKYARDHGYIDWNNMVDDTKLKDINNVEDDVMEKYAKYKINELEKLLEDAFTAGEFHALYTENPKLYDEAPDFQEWKEQALKRLKQ